MFVYMKFNLNAPGNIVRFEQLIADHLKSTPLFTDQEKKKLPIDLGFYFSVIFYQSVYRWNKFMNVFIYFMKRNQDTDC